MSRPLDFATALSHSSGNVFDFCATVALAVASCPSPLQVQLGDARIICAVVLAVQWDERVE